MSSSSTQIGDILNVLIENKIDDHHELIQGRLQKRKKRHSKIKKNQQQLDALKQSMWGWFVNRISSTGKEWIGWILESLDKALTGISYYLKNFHPTVFINIIPVKWLDKFVMFGTRLFQATSETVSDLFDKFGRIMSMFFKSFGLFDSISDSLRAMIDNLMSVSRVAIDQFKEAVLIPFKMIGEYITTKWVMHIQQSMASTIKQCSDLVMNTVYVISQHLKHIEVYPLMDLMFFRERVNQSAKHRQQLGLFQDVKHMDNDPVVHQEGERLLDLFYQFARYASKENVQTRAYISLRNIEALEIFFLNLLATHVPLEDMSVYGVLLLILNTFGDMASRDKRYYYYFLSEVLRNEAFNTICDTILKSMMSEITYIPSILTGYQESDSLNEANKPVTFKTIKQVRDEYQMRKKTTRNQQTLDALNQIVNLLRGMRTNPPQLNETTDTKIKLFKKHDRLFDEYKTALLEYRAAMLEKEASLPPGLDQERDVLRIYQAVHVDDSKLKHLFIKYIVVELKMMKLLGQDDQAILQTGLRFASQLTVDTSASIGAKLEDVEQLYRNSQIKDLLFQIRVPDAGELSSSSLQITQDVDFILKQTNKTPSDLLNEVQATLKRSGSYSGPKFERPLKHEDLLKYGYIGQQYLYLKLIERLAIQRLGSQKKSSSDEGLTIAFNEFVNAADAVSYLNAVVEQDRSLYRWSLLFHTVVGLSNIFLTHNLRSRNMQLSKREQDQILDLKAFVEQVEKTEFYSASNKQQLQVLIAQIDALNTNIYGEGGAVGSVDPAQAIDALKAFENIQSYLQTSLQTAYDHQEEVNDRDLTYQTIGFSERDMKLYDLDMQLSQLATFWYNNIPYIADNSSSKPIDFASQYKATMQPLIDKVVQRTERRFNAEKEEADQRFQKSTSSSSSSSAAASSNSNFLQRQIIDLNNSTSTIVEVIGSDIYQNQTALVGMADSFFQENQAQLKVISDLRVQVFSDFKELRFERSPAVPDLASPELARIYREYDPSRHTPEVFVHLVKNQLDREHGALLTQANQLASLQNDAVRFIFEGTLDPSLTNSSQVDTTGPDNKFIKATAPVIEQSSHMVTEAEVMHRAIISFANGILEEEGRVSFDTLNKYDIQPLIDANKRYQAEVEKLSTRIDQLKTDLSVRLATQQSILARTGIPVDQLIDVANKQIQTLEQLRANYQERINDVSNQSKFDQFATEIQRVRVQAITSGAPEGNKTAIFKFFQTHNQTISDFAANKDDPTLQKKLLLVSQDLFGMFDKHLHTSFRQAFLACMADQTAIASHETARFSLSEQVVEGIKTSHKLLNTAATVNYISSFVKHWQHLQIAENHVSPNAYADMVSQTLGYLENAQFVSATRLLELQAQNKYVVDQFRLTPDQVSKERMNLMLIKMILNDITTVVSPEATSLVSGYFLSAEGRDLTTERLLDLHHTLIEAKRNNQLPDLSDFIPWHIYAPRPVLLNEGDDPVEYMTNITRIVDQPEALLGTTWEQFSYIQELQNALLTQVISINNYIMDQISRNEGKIELKLHRFKTDAKYRMSQVRRHRIADDVDVYNQTLHQLYKPTETIMGGVLKTLWSKVHRIELFFQKPVVQSQLNAFDQSMTEPLEDRNFLLNLASESLKLVSFDDVFGHVEGLQSHAWSSRLAELVDNSANHWFYEDYDKYRDNAQLALTDMLYLERLAKLFSKSNNNIEYWVPEADRSKLPLSLEIVNSYTQRLVSRHEGLVQAYTTYANGGKSTIDYSAIILAREMTSATIDQHRDALRTRKDLSPQEKGFLEQEIKNLEEEEEDLQTLMDLRQNELLASRASQKVAPWKTLLNTSVRTFNSLSTIYNFVGMMYGVMAPPAPLYRSTEENLPPLSDQGTTMINVYAKIVAEKTSIDPLQFATSGNNFLRLTKQSTELTKAARINGLFDIWEPKFPSEKRISKFNFNPNVHALTEGPAMIVRFFNQLDTFVRGSPSAIKDALKIYFKVISEEEWNKHYEGFGENFFLKSIRLHRFMRYVWSGISAALTFANAYASSVSVAQVIAYAAGWASLTSYALSSTTFQLDTHLSFSYVGYGFLGAMGIFVFSHWISGYLSRKTYVNVTQSLQATGRGLSHLGTQRDPTRRYTGMEEARTQVHTVALPLVRTFGALFGNFASFTETPSTIARISHAVLNTSDDAGPLGSVYLANLFRAGNALQSYAAGYQSLKTMFTNRSSIFKNTLMDYIPLLYQMTQDHLQSEISLSSSQPGPSSTSSSSSSRSISVGYLAQGITVKREDIVDRKRNAKKTDDLSDFSASIGITPILPLLQAENQTQFEAAYTAITSKVISDEDRKLLPEKLLMSAIKQVYEHLFKNRKGIVIQPEVSILVATMDELLYYDAHRILRNVSSASSAEQALDELAYYIKYRSYLWILEYRSNSTPLK
jgi:hypothetical protein